MVAETARVPLSAMIQGIFPDAVQEETDLPC